MENRKPGLRSAEVTEGLSRSGHRSLLLSMGWTREETGKPLVAVVNSWTEVVPGHSHLRTVADAVKRGILAAGGTPLEFNTISVCDGLAQGHGGMAYSLPSRDLVAATCEVMLEAHRFDGAVFISSCDKSTPGMLMAAARVDIPAVFITGGYMEPGEFEGRKITISQLREYTGEVLGGTRTQDSLMEAEECACMGGGACAMMGTANTMQALAEALGMAMPGTATVPAMGGLRLRQAMEAGRRVVSLIRENLRPSAILTPAALRNALRVDMAIGGSTNSLLHLPAIARAAGVRLTLDDIDAIGRSTPHLAAINPSGLATVADLNRAGGIPAVQKALLPLLEEQRSVSGYTLTEIAAAARWSDPEVIRPLDRPHKPDGGVAVLRGNLAPGGAVVKTAAVRREMWRFQGPALCFDSMEEAVEAVTGRQVPEGSVVVIRYEGPVGGPGMREMQYITSIFYGMGYGEHSALITDGRFSGATRGPVIGHITPEAATGGPLGVVRDGDLIEIDIAARRLHLAVPEAELARRLSAFQPKRKEVKGILRHYAESVGPTDEGAWLF